jgi:hypothetical protein
LASVSRNPREVETVWPANCPAAEFSRLGQRVWLERRPGPGRVPGPGPGTRSRMLTRPSRVVRCQRVATGAAQLSW